MASIRGPLLLVGAGKMGGALLQGWREAGVAASELFVVEPGEAQRRAVREAGVEHAFETAEELPVGLVPSALVLAVKPQVMGDAAPHYRSRLGPDTLVLSIAAGKAIADFERLLGSDRAIVRAMPNTPAAVGRGASVLCANARVGPAQRALAQGLLEAVGEAFWVEDEELIHVVTALSGGGPAYVFLLIEALAEAGAKLGLPADLAMRLARSTVIGSGELARQTPEPAAQLRRNVTSPAGTTERALAVLMGEKGLAPLIEEALAAAAARSRELAG
jgi:pyrroline-5-carboxylate reductase